MIRRIPISRRIILLVLTISIIPIITVGGFGYLKARSALTQISSNYNVKLIDTFGQNMDLKFQDYSRLADELMLNTTVQQALADYTALSPQERYIAMRDITQDIRSKFTRIADIGDIRIVTTKNIPIYSTGYLYLSDYYNEDNFKKIKENDSSSLWYIARYDKKTFFVLSRKIIDLASGKDIGYIIIHIITDSLSDVLTDFDFGKNATVMLLDSFGSDFCYPDSQTSISSKYKNEIFNEPDSKDVVPYNGASDSFINYSTVRSLGWKLVTTIPYSYLTDPIRSIALGVAVIMIVCILLCIVVSQYIWSSISVPLSKMVTYVEEIPNMNFESYLVDESNDELGYLTEAHNKIIYKMQEMTSQIEKEQEEKRMAEIKMLQAQINPHFLFNTLDSLRFTALMSNVPTVSEGLSSLSHILRNSIIDGKSYITILEEVQNIKDYLTIQKIRCGEIIELSADIQPEAQNCLIMKFLLQPMVENSVIHGMLDNESIRIRLTVRIDGSSLRITLEDNGKGFDMSKQYDANSNRFKSSKLSGVGLENVKQRLALEYGTRQQFTVHSEEGTGTVVTVIFPAEERKEEIYV